MKIYIGSDHAGYQMKEFLKKELAVLGFEVVDYGANELNIDDDYPDFIRKVAEAIANHPELSRGVILGSSGQGEAMCANKIKGIRAGVYYGGDLKIVKLLREHNNANILSLGARFMINEQALEAVKIFIDTSFSNDERHIRRIKKLES